MNQVILSLPGMYGDHHVLRVRAALSGVKGVSDVIASAARRSVAVDYDEAVTSSDAIRTVLEEAGYSSLEAAPATLPKRHQDGSAWFTVLGRITTTERKDREMAGDFRRY
jgi:copper chaperone CopZ